jgi:hypothetical protein
MATAAAEVLTVAVQELAAGTANPSASTLGAVRAGG